MGSVERHRLHRSIKTRSITLFAAYVIALCAVYVAFTVTLLRREAASANERLVQTARMLVAETDSHIAAGRDRLSTVASLPGLMYGLRSIREASGAGHIPPWTTLHYIFFKSPVFTGGVFLVDDTGTVLWTEPPGLEWVGEKVNDLAPIAALFDTKKAVVSALQEPGRMHDAPHVILANPIIGAAGEVAGVLGGIIDVTASQFVGPLAGVSTDADRFAAIVDQDGKTLAGIGTHTAAADDGALVVSSPMTRAPWKVVAGQARSAALVDIIHLQRLLLVAGLLLAVVLVAAGGPFVARLIRSLRELTDAAARMAAGDLSQAVAVASDYEEMVTLAGTFEHMRVELERSHLALTRRVDERDELIRLKEEFLANVSHELRTPLNVIIGYTDMLLDDSRQAEAKEFLQRIRSQSEHLFHLLQDVMTLSALNAGKISVAPETVNIAEILSRLTPNFEACRQGRDIEVQCDVPRDLPTLVTDRERLEQVLANLINNAFKFTPQGRVEVSARHDRQRQRLILEVADTGIGIPADEIEHVFDEFRQVDGSMHRVHEGMGLGLALVRKLTDLLEGDLHVDSQLRAGTRVTVSLPLHLARPREHQEPSRFSA